GSGGTVTGAGRSWSSAVGPGWLSPWGATGVWPARVGEHGRTSCPWHPRTSPTTAARCLVLSPVRGAGRPGRPERRAHPLLPRSGGRRATAGRRHGIEVAASGRVVVRHPGPTPPPRQDAMTPDPQGTPDAPPRPDEVNRLWGHGLHEEKLFYDRL